MTAKANLRSKCWKKNGYLVSTDASLLPISKVMDIFGSADFYWANALSPAAMQEAIDNSLCFGLYEKKEIVEPIDDSDDPANANLVGFARCITDFVTFIYITDVWVDPAQQGKGLGTWLVKCVEEVVEGMPHLRKSLPFTGDWARSVPFYEKLMGMNLVGSQPGEGLAIMERKGRGHPSYGRPGTSYS
ncbi:hypothetical protein VD0002_g9798 [Verticillium dahliae]|uniref:N-acetyltransferase domain-containing protein n=1 Tax=Verticillium dahliae TaxID=27337 RepID=A0AA44WHU7_VERDA|nr:hypothetical protein VdG2_07971 [Verticillium dahliae VDG2]KAH6704829.1 hypothetical protein EV126DRAFT_197275 [Verticillium dahliae]PNH31721.1 hypothetical protein BJF96_g5114 [Verticillium dahliae]PNH41421.1 hypothetical protein VD0003_g9969 [Verticillium dahliae]PNH56420.1 hypothetical protein VD0002_g9798 [Verticillium dahliae]